MRNIYFCLIALFLTGCAHQTGMQFIEVTPKPNIINNGYYIASDNPFHNMFVNDGKVLICDPRDHTINAYKVTIINSSPALIMTDGYAAPLKNIKKSGFNYRAQHYYSGHPTPQCSELFSKHMDFF